MSGDGGITIDPAVLRRNFVYVPLAMLGTAFVLFVADILLTLLAPKPIMKLIPQEDPSGCGIACVAMVAGRSYQGVKRRWLENFPDAANKLNSETLGAGGLTVGEIIQLLATYYDPLNLRVKCDGKQWWIIGPHWAITNPKEFWWTHWVVIEDGLTLNPGAAECKWRNP